MKKILLVTAALLLAHGVFSQGTIVFSNHGGMSTTAAPGLVNAPVFGPENNDPGSSIDKTGNTQVGNPMGTQTYSGSPLYAGYLGGTWTATLWGLDSSQVTGGRGANNLILIGTTTFHTISSGTFAGTVLPPAAAPSVPGITSPDQRGAFQMRVWDTKGGTIATWDQVIAHPSVLHGESEIFTVNYSLGSTMFPIPNVPPFLQGLQSFNLYSVPEPSVIALVALGAGCLLLLCRRK